MTTTHDDGREHRAPTTTGRVLHSALGYDLFAWLFLLGREPAFRDRILDLANLAPGESVLDVGCGTGTLAIRAKQRMGASGSVRGIDASPTMIARARRKALKANVAVDFETAAIEALPFPDARFDLVLGTLMLHHLPRVAREQGAREIRRVLKRGGRVVVVDFGASPERRTLLGHFHRHGHTDAQDVRSMLNEAGLGVAESGALGMKSLWFTKATAS